MKLVVDASVAVMWFVRQAGAERSDRIALELLQRFTLGEIDLYQPPHFLAEVSSVLARLVPDTALLNVRDLLDLDFSIVDEPDVYAIGTDLAVEFGHHLFDTLYHAVALQRPDLTLITADRQYFRKSRGVGQVQLIEHWSFVA